MILLHRPPAPLRLRPQILSNISPPALGLHSNPKRLVRFRSNLLEHLWRDLPRLLSLLARPSPRVLLADRSLHKVNFFSFSLDTKLELTFSTTQPTGTYWAMMMSLQLHPHVFMIVPLRSVMCRTSSTPLTDHWKPPRRTDRPRNKLSLTKQASYRPCKPNCPLRKLLMRPKVDYCRLFGKDLQPNPLTFRRPEKTLSGRRVTSAP